MAVLLTASELNEVIWRTAELLCDIDHDNPVTRQPCKRCLRTAQRDITASQERQRLEQAS